MSMSVRTASVGQGVCILSRSGSGSRTKRLQFLVLDDNKSSDSMKQNLELGLNMF